MTFEKLVITLLYEIVSVLRSIFLIYCTEWAQRGFETTVRGTINRLHRMERKCEEFLEKCS